MTADDYLWDPKAPSDPDIVRLENALRPLRNVPPEPEFARLPQPPRRRWVHPVLAAAGLLFVVAYAVARMSTQPWAVRALAGSATVASDRVDSASGVATRIGEGQWLETAAGSRAEINIGRIGRAVFGPGSRVQVVRAEAREHRLTLARGTMHARIWAPPRFFLVQTASAVAVDLGCVYFLSVDESGAGELSVESGEVELVEGTRRALVPAGNVVSIIPGVGPGLPISRRAPANFQSAVRIVERNPDDAAALEHLLSISTAESSITLWHVLQRVSHADRRRVYARLTEIAPPPPGVGADDLVALERRALRVWKEHLESSWTTETIPWWKRTWRKTWTFLLTVG